MPSLTTSGSPTFTSGYCTIDSTGSDLVTGPSNLFSNTQGWIALRCRFRWAGNTEVSPHRLWSWRDAANDGLELYFGGDAVLWSAAQATGVETTAQVSYTAAAETDHTIVSHWRTGDTRISLDGAANVIGAARGANNPIDVSTFSIFRYGPSAAQWGEGDVYWMAGGSGTISDADAATLHAFGNTDPTWGALPSSPTFLWAANDETYLDAAPSTNVILPAWPRVRFNG